MTNWKNKLLAFLHDPPHKPYRLAGHEDARESFLREVGLTLDDMRHHFVRMDDQGYRQSRSGFSRPAATRRGAVF